MSALTSRAPGTGTRTSTSTRILCVVGDCDGAYQVVKGDDETDDALTCPRCGDEWTLDRWPLLAALDHSRSLGGLNGNADHRA